jgi:hypothetical protein
MTTMQTAPNDGTNDKLPLSIEQIAEDLSLSNEEGNSWYNYRLPEDTAAIAGQRVILADEYDDLGKVIATHKIWIEVEYAETGTLPAEFQE